MKFIYMCIERRSLLGQYRLQLLVERVLGASVNVMLEFSQQSSNLCFMSALLPTVIMWYNTFPPSASVLNYKQILPIYIFSVCSS